MHPQPTRLTKSFALQPLILALLLLTPRVFAATLTVTNFADSGPGTLRNLIAAAAPDDTINFALPGTIALNSQLTINKNLRIEGRTFLAITAQNNSRVFNITGGNVAIFSMMISDGRVVGTNGLAGQNGQNAYGGAIFVANGADLLMQFCVLSNNTVVGGQGGPENQFGTAGNGGNAYGGAIASLGTLNFAYCSLIRNSVSGGLGGTVTNGANFPGSGGQGWGGGVYVEALTYISSSAIYSNNAIAGAGGGGPGTGGGGGIYNAAQLYLSYSTIASNMASGSTFDSGGGVSSVSPITIRDCTIVGNQADYGGGITGGDVANTIIAGNAAGNGPDGIGTITSSDYNFIQNTSGLTIAGITTHNITGQNPLLGPLANYGGPSLSMMPLPGSPVLDKGRSTTSQDQRLRPRPYDSNIPNAVGGNGTDIGSIEVNPTTFFVLNTNNTGPGSLRQVITDNNGLGGSNTIVFSNTVAGTITLNVELTLTAPTIIRGPGPTLLTLSGNNASRVFTVLEGPSLISGLTIRNGRVVGSQGQQGQDGFDAYGGGIFNQATLTLSNCVVRSNTVVGGMGGERHLGSVGKGGRGFGGGLYNAGAQVSFINCSWEGNRAEGGQGGSSMNGEAGDGGNGLGGAVCTIGGTNQTVACNFMNNVARGGMGGVSSGGDSGTGGQGNGAGIYSESVVQIYRSTLSQGNAAGGLGGGGGSPGASGSGYGGGIYNVADLGLISCTMASNNASGSSFDFGGAVYSVGSAGLTNCTIARNQADYGGGWHGNATVANSIFAGNFAGSQVDFAGTLNSYDYNLVQSFSGLNILGVTAHVLIGQDPLLGPLQNNGGPTFTMALLPGSPAIDQGWSFGIMSDQRGAVRPHNLPAVADAGGGDGSDIGAFEFLPTPALSIQRAPGNKVVLSWATDVADYRLESVSSLPAANNWVEVTDARTYVGNQAFVTNAASGAGRFFRLASPVMQPTP